MDSVIFSTQYIWLWILIGIAIGLLLLWLIVKIINRKQEENEMEQEKELDSPDPTKIIASEPVPVKELKKNKLPPIPSPTITSLREKSRDDLMKIVVKYKISNIKTNTPKPTLINKIVVYFEELKKLRKEAIKHGTYVSIDELVATKASTDGESSLISYLSDKTQQELYEIAKLNNLDVKISSTKETLLSKIINYIEKNRKHYKEALKNDTSLNKNDNVLKTAKKPKTTTAKKPKTTTAKKPKTTTAKKPKTTTK